MAIQLRLMLGERRALSRVGSTAAAWSLVGVINASPRWRAGCCSCADPVAGW